ncbi:histidine phosphatase family protein [Corynebacterium lubricantis]|uniref:histidine phosphatase family protein n=1 Tax=Corynebacterium lubricantis TaxID=541095 RepID=UPI0003630424|nr:histidine phosphatase family protein [Corynebacterium lubricantis]
MDTLILLVRHGVTPTTGQVLPGRAPGLHLSAKGVEQAEEVATRIDRIDAIYSSPLERTQETALPLARRHSVPVLIDDCLIECEFGTWTGAKLADLAKLPEWKTVQQSPEEFRFPGGESFVEMQERMGTGLRRIAAKHPGEVVACFSHADPIKAAVTWLEGTPLNDFQKVAIDPASITVARIGAGGTEVVSRNTRSGVLDIDGLLGN